MKTGYRVGKIVGFDDDYLLVDSSDIEDQCSRCCRYDSEAKVCYNDDLSCLHDNYYYIRPSKNKMKKLSHRYRIIDMKKLSDSCKDLCIYYNENCYNNHKDTCLLRLIESSLTGEI